MKQFIFTIVCLMCFTYCSEKETTEEKPVLKSPDRIAVEKVIQKLF